MARPQSSLDFPRLYTQKIDATTAVSASTFNKNNVTFRWTVGGTQHWIPSQTFMRIRVKLNKPAADAKDPPVTLENADGIAPAMGLCANLWQKLSF